MVIQKGRPEGTYKVNFKLFYQKFDPLGLNAMI